MPLYVLKETLSPTEKEVLALHDNVPEYQERLIIAKGAVLHGEFGKLAKVEIATGDRVIDLGVGLGAVAHALIQNGHCAWRGGVDISKPYLCHVLGERIYDDCWLGRAATFCAKMLAEGRQFEWATLVSVAYYFPPKQLSELLVALSHLCTKGVIITIDRIPDVLIEKWRSDTDRPLSAYNHQKTFQPLAHGFGVANLVTTLEEGWSHSLTGIPVPVDLWVLHSPQTAS